MSSLASGASIPSAKRRVRCVGCGKLLVEHFLPVEGAEFEIQCARCCEVFRWPPAAPSPVDKPPDEV